MPDEDALSDSWERCREDWLNQIQRRSGARNSLRAYAADVAQFSQFCPLWRATREDAERWVQALSEDGLAVSTIRRKLAALASLYRYAIEERGLVMQNPFAARSLRPPVRECPVKFPTSEQILDLLDAIDTRQATGLRNKALIAALVQTTRRVNEMLALRGRDFTHVGQRHWFAYRCKGGRIERQQLPDSIWQMIEGYLRAADRWPLADDAYVWVALSANGARLHHRNGDGALNAGYVVRLIKRYGRLAGIPEECLYAHALRHAGAQMRREQGADVLELQRVLGHRHPTSTLGYLRRIELPQDQQGEAIADLLLRQAGAITLTIAPGTTDRLRRV